MKKSEKIILSIFYLLIILSIFIFDSYKSLSRIAYILLAAIMPMILNIIERLFNIKLNEYIKNAYYIFILISMVLGNIYGFYAYYNFDKALHFSSGILISAAIFIIYSYLNKNIILNTKKDFYIASLFTQGINMLIAFFWESFEFSLLVFFNNDAIHHFDQGVYDVMGDMIVCFIGSLFIIYLIYHFYKTQKENLLIKATKRFLNDNI